MLYLPQKHPNNNNNNNRATNSKTRSLIVIYSPLHKNEEDLIKIALGLVGVKNEIINIKTVNVENI
jgi:hypothetical protein